MTTHTTTNPATTPANFTLRRGDERGRTELGWLHSWHSFSFGRHIDRNNMGYRSLRVINDDIVEPGGGFGTHPHDNMEIITWMIDGALEHADSTGTRGVIRPGEAQVMTAGSGIEHSEVNASKTDQAHLLQIWIEPAKRNTEPRYGQKKFDAAGRRDTWQLIASPDGADDSMPIGQDARLRIADVSAGGTVDIDVAADRHTYVHVATGSVRINGVTLDGGDAVTFSGPATVTVGGAAESQVLWFDLP